jgi:hypothetical protein
VSTRSGTWICRCMGNASPSCWRWDRGRCSATTRRGGCGGSGGDRRNRFTSPLSFRGTTAPKGITRHRARNLVEADRALVVGIPVTSVARTILDLAWKLRSDQLARVLAQAEDLGLLDLDELYAVIERNRGHHGAKRLRYALATYERPIWTRSDFERRFVENIPPRDRRAPPAGMMGPEQSIGLSSWSRGPVQTLNEGGLTPSERLVTRARNASRSFGDVSARV